jgi:plasmid stability protein
MRNLTNASACSPPGTALGLSFMGPEPAPVRNPLTARLNDAVDEQLKARAAGNNRSLEAELREILELASKQVDVNTARKAAAAMRRRLEGRPHGDSGEILAEERLR